MSTRLVGAWAFVFIFGALAGAVAMYLRLG